MNPFMTVIEIIATLGIALVSVFLWLRRKNRAVVDGAVITAHQDTHCTAIVTYRERRRVIRFAAEVGAPAGGKAFLWVDIPESNVYTDSGEKIPDAELRCIKTRVSQGLSKLGIQHELESPEWIASRNLR